jgi:hypothetical protein
MTKADGPEKKSNRPNACDLQGDAVTEHVHHESLIPTQEATDSVLSPEDTLAQLVARVDHLESQNEGLKRVGALGLLLVLVLGGIVVHQTWADLSGISTGGVTLHDSDHEIKSALTLNGDHVAVVPTNLMGTLPSLQSTQGLDLKGLGVYDSQGFLRIVIGVDSNDNPKFAVLDTSGRAVWVAKPNVPPAPKGAAAKPGAAGAPAPGATPAATPPAPVATPPAPSSPTP